MINSKEEAKKWICSLLDKYSYSFNKIFPKQSEENTGHFFKIDFNSDCIIIDGEYGRGGKFNNKFRNTIHYNGLKNIKVRRCKDLEAVKSVIIIFYYENLDKTNQSNTSWFGKFFPKTSKIEETEIILHEELLNDKGFSEDKLMQAFKLFTTI
jgi:hypothetical protein